MSMGRQIMVLLVAMAAAGNAAVSACGQRGDIIDLSGIAISPDCRAEFPGGDEAMQEYIHSHFVMPTWCQDGDIIGKVKVAFVVSKSGQITQAAVTKTLNPDIDAEALRVVKSLPKFSPATIGGQPVDCLRSTTIQIRITI